MSKGRIIRIDGSENKVKIKRKPQQKYIQSDFITNYMRDRDRLIWKLFPESRKEIEERWTNTTQ